MKNTMEITCLDDAGLIVAPSNELLPVYDFKAMTKYCEKVGKTKTELSDEERDVFILYWSK